MIPRMQVTPKFYVFEGALKIDVNSMKVYLEDYYLLGCYMM